MLNFAHGDVIMIGAYVCFYAISRFELPPLISILLAMAVCTLLGVVIERLAYKPLRSAPSLAVLITAIGVSYFCRTWRCCSGPQPQGVPPLSWEG